MPAAIAPIRAQHAGLTKGGSSVVLTGRLIRADGTLEPRGRIYVRRLDQYDCRPMPGTDGVEGYAQSTDGEWLAVLVAADETSPQRLVKLW